MKIQKSTSFFRMRFFDLIVSLGALGLSACGANAPLASNVEPIDANVDDVFVERTEDSSVSDVIAASDSTQDSRVIEKTNPCPKPSAIRLTNLPSEFMPAVEVQLAWAVDGDTAHLKVNGYDMPPSVRFLYVNTEESHTSSTTAFGIRTAVVVKEYLSKAVKIHIAPHINRSKPNNIDVDDFGRWLALVFVDGELFQTRLVREGWTAYYTKYGCATSPIHQNLLYSEAEAFFAQRGIWEVNHPTNYSDVLKSWIGTNRCRPNPYKELYCK